MVSRPRYKRNLYGRMLLMALCIAPPANRRRRRPSWRMDTNFRRYDEWAG